MLENLVNQVIGKGEKGSGTIGNYTYQSLRPTCQEPPCQLHSSPGKPEVRKQRAAPPSLVPQTWTVSTTSSERSALKACGQQVLKKS